MVTSRSRIGLICVAAAAVVALFAMTGTAAAATGNIEGKVVDAITGVGIEEVEVCAFDAGETEEFCKLTDPAGEYVLSGVPEGSYLVEFWAVLLGYETRYYNESASFEGADLVGVLGSGTTTGINAKLSKPAPHVDPLPPSTPSVPALPAPVAAPPALPAAVKPKPAPHCKKGFKPVKRHGHTVCAKKHKKKHRS
jgi:hypothetical protein